MKTYLEIKIPIKYDDSWFEELRSHFAGIPVRWQKDFYHVTMVFVNDTPKDVDLCPLLEKHLNTTLAPKLTFDRLDAFAVRSGKFVIHLTASEVPNSFLAMVDAIRLDMTAAGCVITSDFMLHVTLGRLRDFNIQLPELKRRVKSFPMPSLPMVLTDVDYREFRGKVIYETQLVERGIEKHEIPL